MRVLITRTEAKCGECICREPPHPGAEAVGPMFEYGRVYLLEVGDEGGLLELSAITNRRLLIEEADRTIGNSMENLEWAEYRLPDDVRWHVEIVDGYLD